MVSAGTIERDGKRYTTGTIRDVTEQLRVQRELEHNARHDLLTGLPNRVFFEQQLASAMVEARESVAANMPCFSWISTASSWSTTASVMLVATCCWYRSPTP